MSKHQHQYVEGQARSNGTRYARYEVCQRCGLVHEWTGDEETGVERHTYRAGAGYDEYGMLPDAEPTEPSCLEAA
jgi:hypothetical protein